MNPLLDFSALPRYPELRPEHIAPAMDQLLAEGRATVEGVFDVAAQPDLLHVFQKDDVHQ